MAESPEAGRPARQERRVAVVLAVTGLVWGGAQAMIPAFGIGPRGALLLDLAALAAFVWSFAAVWRIWRRRRDE